MGKLEIGNMPNNRLKLTRSSTFITFTFCCVLLTLLISGCAKEDTLPNSPATPATSANFSWTVNGLTTTADSAICYLQLTTVYAYKNGLSQTIELNLSDIISDTYPVNAVSGNEIKYVNGSSNLSVSTGTVFITNTTGSKINGNFSGTFPAGGGSISGQFTDVAFR
jgi:hypothetical protein